MMLGVLPPAAAATAGPTAAPDDAAAFASSGSAASVPPQLPHDQGKLTVVVDLDETLIHSYYLHDETPGEEQQRVIPGDNDAAQPHQQQLEAFDVDVRGTKLRVLKRPGLDVFLEWAAQHFELVCFTASRASYADAILDVLDPHNRIFRHRLYRHHCTPVRQQPALLVKDLAQLNRPLERLCLVDNSLHSFLSHMRNGIPIASFFDSPHDRALGELACFLNLCRQQTDVRALLDRAFNLELSVLQALKASQLFSLQQQHQQQQPATQQEDLA